MIAEKNHINIPIYFDHAHQTKGAAMRVGHFHNGYEIGYLITGHRNCFVDEQLYQLKSGDMTLISARMVHRFTPTVEGELERIVINVAENWMPEELLPCFDHVCYHIPAESAPEVRAILHAIETEYNRPVDDYHFGILRSKVYELLAFLARLSKQKPTVVRYKSREEWLERVTRYIGAHYAEPLTLQDMADEFFMSREYFSVRFKKLVGIGFSEYLNQLRVSYAIKLLDQPDMTVTEAAYRCGFNDSAYFATVFKRFHGITPKKYQQSRTRKD